MACITFFVYNFTFNNFIANVSQKGTKKPRIHVRFIFTNLIWAAVFFVVFIKNPPLYVTYLIHALLLLINFTITPSMTIRGLFFVSTVSITNSILLNFLVLSFFSFVYRLPIKDVVSSAWLFTMSIIIAETVLLIMLFLFKRNRFSLDIIRLTETRNYSEMISIGAVVLLVSIIFDSAYFYSDKYIEGQFAINIVTSIIYSLLFYYLLVYTIKFANMNLYRRKTDEIRDVYHRTIAKRAIMESQVLLDGLTNLYNRKFMYDAIGKLCAAHRDGFVVMYIDANGLKYVNDTFGHQSGDRYLQAVSYAISSSLREQDYAGRIGGDEFLVLLENIQEKDICIVERRIHDAIEVQNELEKEFNMSVSIGSLYVDSELARNGPAHVMEEADIVMRENKAAFYAERGVVS